MKRFVCRSKSGRDDSADAEFRRRAGCDDSGAADVEEWLMKNRMEHDRIGGDADPVGVTGRQSRRGRQ